MTELSNKNEIANLKTDIAVMKVNIKQLEKDVEALEKSTVPQATFNPYIRLFWIVVGGVVTGLVGLGFTLLTRGNA